MNDHTDVEFRDNRERKSMSNLTAAIVISTMARVDDLRQSLSSIQGLERQPEQIVIVDDGDISKTREAVDNIELPIDLVEGPGNGLPASRNEAIEYVETDVVCFIDDDVVLPPNWLSEILQTYQTFDADGVGGSVINYTPTDIGKGNMESPTYRLLTAVRTLLFYNRIGDVGPAGILYAPHTMIGTNAREVDSFQGCNMTFRTSVFEEAEFDEWYGVGGAAPVEEVDFCTRLTTSGRKLVYNPRAVLIHKRTESGGERNKTKAFRNIRNMSFFTFHRSQMIRTSIVLLLAMTIVSCVKHRSGEPVKALFRGYREHRSRATDTE